MSARDMIKKTILENFTTNSISVNTCLITLAVSCILAIYIFFVYYVITKKVFYQKNFNISLLALVVITTGIILAMQSNLVISLGMVGALSIVRFRTAVREPLDLIFLFWSISIGIICGAGLFWLAIIIAIVVTILIVVFDILPIGRADELLVLNLDDVLSENEVLNEVKQYAKQIKVKSRSMNGSSYDMIVEYKGNKPNELIMRLSKMQQVNHVAIFTHEGEATF